MEAVGFFDISNGDLSDVGVLDIKFNTTESINTFEGSDNFLD